ncbi:MAG: ion transporter [Methanobacteriaceae archaeon]|nr:ion transporter [Methanobacteriaceae archaeon]
MKVERKIRRVYELLCFILVIFYAFTLLMIVVFEFEPNNLILLIYADLLVSLLLFVEFYLRIKNLDDKWSYIKRNWTDILVITPLNFIILMLAGEITPLVFISIKVIALIKIVALYKFSQEINEEVLEFADKTKLIYGVTIYLAIILFGSLAVFHIENGLNPNIQNLGDGFWFIMQTITTAGYGDVVPHTSTGRVIGLMAMFAAIGFSSILTATATTAILEKFRRERESVKEENQETMGHLFEKLNDMDNQMKEIKSEMENLKEIIKK